MGSHYAILLVAVDDYRQIDGITQQVQSDLEVRFPDAVVNVKKFSLGPGAGGKIQLRINGSDPAKLRELADVAKNIIRRDPDAKAVRDEWGAWVKTVRPMLADSRAIKLIIGPEAR